MTEPSLLVVTEADLDALDSEAFDAVWTALGLILRSRRRVEPAVTLMPAVPVVVAPVEPQEVETVSTSRVVCPDCGEPKKNNAGLASHRRTQHIPTRKKVGAARIATAQQTERDGIAATAAEILSRDPERPINGQDFTARAASRHADAWAERHPEARP